MRSWGNTLSGGQRALPPETGDEFALKGRHSSGNKGNFESGQSKSKMSSKLLIYSNIENATLYSLHSTQVANFYFTEPGIANEK